MVIAWDRRSGVSRSIPRWFHPTPGSDPNRTERPSCSGWYAILEGDVFATSGGTFGAGCQRQPKCHPSFSSSKIWNVATGPTISCWMIGALRCSTSTRLVR
jgi:hypothetical protein